MVMNRGGDRVSEVLEQIARGNEMSVELVSTEYSPANPFPVRSRWLRLMIALLRVDVPFVSTLGRRGIERMLGGRISVAPGFSCLYGNVFGGPASVQDTRFIDYANVYVGTGTGFSFENIVITSTHDLARREIIRVTEIVIGQNVWIASRVVILPGVRIGAGSVIASGSLVSCDIPPGVLAAGAPAKVVRKI